MKLSNYLFALVASAALVPTLSQAISVEQISEKSQNSEDAAWKRLKSSKWIRDGKADAPRIVYVISDPNCGWCHRFWDVTRPWVNAGKVQIRHILVGFIQDSSEGRAAAILSAQDQLDALAQNELSIKQGKGGLAPAPVVSAEVEKTLSDNFQLMKDFGFQGTPAIIYADESGDMVTMSGFPGKHLEKVMGSPVPN